MNTVEFLRTARAFIDTPEKWTKRANARDVKGRPADATGPFATCFCLLGAMYRTSSQLRAPGRVEDRARNVVRGVVGGAISSFNDDAETTHANVLAALDRAIALEEEALAHA